MIVVDLESVEIVGEARTEQPLETLKFIHPYVELLPRQLGELDGESGQMLTVRLAYASVRRVGVTLVVPTIVR